MTRADRNRNPTAITVDLAKQAGLVPGRDYEVGDKFPSPSTFATARLLGDPVEISLRVIDAVGFYTRAGQGRWQYIAFPDFLWHSLSRERKVDIIGWMYHKEGGTEMRALFPNYGKT